MERKTIELILPESKARVTLYELLVSGDFRAIQSKILESVDIDFKGINKKEDLKMPTNIPASAIIDSENFTVRLCIKSVVNFDNTIPSDINEFVYNLSSEDNNILFEKVREISNASKLSSEAKKK